MVTYPYYGPKNGTGTGTYVTYNGINGLGGKAQFAFKSNGELYYRVFWGASPADDKGWSKVKLDEPVPSQTPAYLSLFEKVAVIGDSYASGEIYDKDGRNQHGDQYNHSWLAILARKYGFNYYNYSKGGQTAYGWMHETPRSHGEFTTDNKHFDFYFLNLGINDHNRNSADYAGVKADIANGTNSFYGEYGRIIETIKAKDPKAPIAIATITTSFGDGNYKRYNDVIRSLSRDYGLILIDFGDNITNENITSIVKRGGHPTAAGYAKLAQAFDDGFNDAVAEQEADISNLKELFSD
ncbi:SGNH/GDSL hydrolase family protein [Ligilactobacillus salivarius]|uniref:SGNH/GDSL hydrolase family protein n=1 Tax=Ligilactobacillus salivarius TaxID=1624 RepID=UPI001CDA6ECA|nr:SGNH/GDSL hydrolase family protein [Ligilactobacillus salivarius]